MGKVDISPDSKSICFFGSVQALAVREWVGSDVHSFLLKTNLLSGGRKQTQTRSNRAKRCLIVKCSQRIYARQGTGRVGRKDRLTSRRRRWLSQDLVDSKPGTIGSIERLTF